MDMDVCCAYFCTGLSVFGVIALVRCHPPSSRAAPSRNARSPHAYRGVHVPPAGRLIPPPPRILWQLFLYGVLTSGGEWYLGVSHEDAPAAASACMVAAGIYGLYLIYCGMKLMKPAPTSTKIKEDEV